METIFIVTLEDRFLRACTTQDVAAFEIIKYMKANDMDDILSCDFVIYEEEIITE